MSQSGRIFRGIRLRGGRYEAGGFPVETLAELARYERLVADVARQLWIDSNPGRKRAPRGFNQAFDLRLKDIEPGSVVPVLEWDVRDTEDYGADVFERAQEVVEDALRSMNDLQTLPREFPRSALSNFSRFGSSLQDNEMFEFQRDGRTPVRFTKTTRNNFLRAADVKFLQIDALIVGRVSAVNVDEQTFQFDSRRHGVVGGGFTDESLVEDFLAVTNVTKSAPLTRLSATMRQDAQGRIREIVDVDDLEFMDLGFSPVNERLATLADLEAGWLDGDGSRIEFAALEAARDLTEGILQTSIDMPGVFPTVEGGIQFEWQDRDGGLASIEFDAALQFFAFTSGWRGTTDAEVEPADITEAASWIAGVFEK